MYNIIFGRKKKFQLNKAETTYKVHYLGNVMTSLIKGGYHHGQINTINEQKSLKSSLNQSDILMIDESSIKQKVKIDEEISTFDEDEEDNETVSSLSLSSIKSSSQDKRFNNIVCNLDKPVKILWDNHLKHNGHAGLKMKLTITQGGLRVDTKDHGLTEYYGHRIHFIQSHPLHPKLFIWVYQHVGKNLKTEIRCHAALCHNARDSHTIEVLLNERLQKTFLEYKREKRRMQNSRLCNSKNGLLAGQFGTRKRSFRCTKNYKPPVQHGMSSAPKLDDVIEEEEDIDEREIDDGKHIDDESEENDDTFLENEIEHAQTQSLNEEAEDEDEDNDEEETTFNEDHDYINYNLNDDESNKRPVMEQLILSSSSTSSTSSSPSSQSPSPLHSNLSSPSFNQTKQQSDENNFVTGSSISSSSSTSSQSSELINYSNQTYLDLDLENNSTISNFSNTAEENLNRKLNNDLLVDKKFKNKLIDHIESLKLTDEKFFNEVSYDFLADLSKTNKTTLSHSKSFSNKHHQMSLKDNANSETKPSNGFYNPFRRTNISKSFSTFTTRLKQQQKQKAVDFLNLQNSLKAQLKEQSINDDLINEVNFKQNVIFKNQTNNVRSSNGLVKNFSNSASPLSSPDLSTSSSSSLNSSIITKNCQSMQSSNDNY